MLIEVPNNRIEELEASRSSISFSVLVELEGGLRTTAHVVRHERQRMRPRVVVFDEPITLLDWCAQSGATEAIVGGYDLHHFGTLLGDVWVAGRKYAAEPVIAPWDRVRGCISIDPSGEVTISARKDLPRHPAGDLLQVGPVLVKDGMSLMVPGVSPEGFSATAEQFTPDPSVGRHPRAAIGYDENYIWAVACNGRGPGEAGLDFSELADVLVSFGVKDGLNLDGGSSTQLVHGGVLLNDPWGQHNDHFPDGRPITTAIIFEQY